MPKAIKLNPFISGMKCPRCNLFYPLDLYKIRCSKCESFLEIVYDYDRAKRRVSKWKLLRRLGIWKYKELLPYPLAKDLISLGEGSTPLISTRRLVPGVRLLLKNEAANPTGSFLDRGSCLIISLLNGIHRKLVCAVNANLAVSLAAYCAKVGMKLSFFCPPDIDRGEFYQAIALGAEVHVVRSQKEAYERSSSLRNGYYYVDSANPFLLEGEKTTAFELAEQLSWKWPTWIVVPVGTGGHITMIWKAVKELSVIRIVRSKPPRLVGVQPKSYSPLVDLFDGSYNRDYYGTIARDLVFVDPPKLFEAYRAIKESKGIAVRVDDKEIIKALKDLASKEGILAEPAAASTIAAIRKLREEGIIEKGDTVAAIITGSGLKNPDIIKSLIESKRRERTLTKTKIFILKAIRKLGGRGYGYEIKKILESEYSLGISLPTIYHHLKELEQMGFLRRLNIVDKRIVNYELTTEALQFLKKNA